MPTHPRSRRWALSEMTLLSRMALEGRTAEDIAAALDRTVEAVRMKAAHQRLVLTVSDRPRGRWPEPQSPGG